MATTTKKGSKGKNARLRRSVKATQTDKAQTITKLRQELAESLRRENATRIENVRLLGELQERNRDLTEALEQQTATGEVLRVIASSPTELQPVLDTLLANAVKLSGASKGHIRQHDGEVLRYVAHYNESPELVDALKQLPHRPRPDGMGTRALVERKPIHVLDAQAESSYRAP
jgi:two-component system, NtrC family, sensor kinase